MIETSYTIGPIGVIHSELSSLEAAPRQGDEGAPAAWLELTAEAAPGLAGISAGDELIILTWLHLARRDVLQVHPRGNPETPLTGVFATRSPDRPNPVGLHRVSVLEVVGQRIRVEPLETIDGTRSLISSRSWERWRSGKRIPVSDKISRNQQHSIRRM